MFPVTSQNGTRFMGYTPYYVARCKATEYWSLIRIGGIMYLNFALYEPNWQIVSTLSSRTVKNLKNGTMLRRLLEDCRRIEDCCGCYAWMTRSAIYDCVCFGADYKRYGFTTNLEGQLSYEFGPAIDPITHRPSSGALL